MKLIVGLGNPGEKYEKTRHNLGFMVLDHLLKDLEGVKKSSFNKEEKLKSDIYLLDYQPKNGEMEKVILAKPLTYMNNSGMAVSLITHFYKIKPIDLWVIHDELDLPLGSMKIRFGGSSAGHHGVESILSAIGTDKFWRFRMGIGKDNSQNSKLRNVDDFVLGGFMGSEKGTLKHAVKRGYEAIIEALEDDILSAMNRFNTK